MSEMLGGHQVVCLYSFLDIFAMDADSHSHDHVLRSLGHLAIDPEQIRSLQGLEAKVLVAEITVIDHGRVKLLLVLFDDLVDVIGNHGRMSVVLWVDVFIEILANSGEGFLGLLMQVGDGDPGSEDGVVWVLCSHVSGSLRGEIVELDCGDTLVHTSDDLTRVSKRERKYAYIRVSTCETAKMNAPFV